MCALPTATAARSPPSSRERARRRSSGTWPASVSAPCACCSGRPPNGRFLFVYEGCATRPASLRRIGARLRRGDAVLLFPAGGLEPEAALAPDLARASLERWSRSIALFGRLAPATRIVPAFVS